LRDDHEGGIDSLPHDIDPVPQIPTISKTEDGLTASGTAHEIGKTYSWKCLEERNRLGVHLVGEGASGLVHIGQVLMATGAASIIFPMR
jgi:NAD(P) transhydrogenase